MFIQNILQTILNNKILYQKFLCRASCAILTVICHFYCRMINIHENESTEVQTLGVIRIQLIYSINVLSKYSSLISHRPSIFEGRHIDHRSSKVNTSIFEGQHIDLRRSTHRSPKVNTSIFEGQHIDLRRSTHRSSKVDTS